MPITNQDFQLILSGRYADSQDWQAVFFYKCTGGGNGDSVSLNNAFEASILPPFSLFQTNAVDYTQIETFALLNAGDFFSQIPGTGSGTVVPPNSSYSKFWDAVGFRLNRSTRLSRNGSKRLPGFPEDYTDAAGNITNLPYLGLVNGAANAMQLPITSAGFTYQLCIPQRELEPNPDAPPAEHYVLRNLYPVSTVQFSRITTQNSRKTW